MTNQVEPISSAHRVNHYSTLGVAEHATQEQIRAAYRRAVQRCHPDRFQHEPQAEDAFKEITAAYKVLRDERSRRDYDRRLGFASSERSEQLDDEPMRASGDQRDESEDPVGVRDCQAFERSAEAHAESGIGALKIASNLIAEGSPYAVAWQLAWRARRGHLAQVLESQTGSIVSRESSRAAAELPRADATAPDSEPKWRAGRERRRRFGGWLSRLKSPSAR